MSTTATTTIAIAINTKTNSTTPRRRRRVLLGFLWCACAWLCLGPRLAEAKGIHVDPRDGNDTAVCGGITAMCR